MQADIEQDIDGKLWLLVGYDGQTGKTYKISHEMATAPPVAPPIRIETDVKWPEPRPVWFSAGEAIITPPGLSRWVRGAV